MASTPPGLRFGKTFERVHPRPRMLDPRLPPALSQRSPLATAWRHLNRALDVFVADGLAAA
ncbi:hypothetical protein [Frankia sp. Cr1]|uniref:hypothetical protein n=1 Tax=Frankia sp. Cr1 TaxID=3073931 RepID=UPI002AD4D8D4|nr:hypothetical protein [Frankia sp. Cr1]